MADSNPGLWGALYDALKLAGIQIPTGANSQFQFVTEPTVAGWTDANTLYYSDFYGNYASADMGPVYNRAVATISDAYYDFINSLEYSDPSSDPKYRSLVTQQKLLVTNLGQLNTDSVGAYKSWVANGGPTTFPDIKNYTDWLASAPAGGQQYAAQITDLQTQLNQINLQLIPFQQGADKAISLAIKNADPSNMVTATVPGSGGLTKKVYLQSIAPNLATQLQGWISGAKSYSVNATFTHDTKYSGDWNIEGGGSSFFDDGFFGFFAEGEANYHKKVESDSHFKCTLTVQANQMFGISRDGWFDGSLVAEYPNGPWSGKTPDMYFGPQGTLKLVTSQMLVSYGTSLSLTVSQSTMTDVRESWEQASGIMIGPFFIGSESVHHAQVTTNEDGSQTLTVGSTDNNAYITGVLSQSFYNEVG